MGLKAKKTFSVRAIQDKIVIRDPEHFVQLRVTLNGVSETIICPHDFDSLIDELIDHTPGFSSFQIHGRHGVQMERLGLLKKTARGSWYGTKLFHKHAAILSKAFSQRFDKILSEIERGLDED